MSEALSVWQWIVGVLFGKGESASSDSTWWQNVISTSNAGLVSATLWERLRGRPDLIAGIGTEARDYLEALHELTASRNAALIEQLAGAATALSAGGIESLPLKGSAYLLENLPDARFRHTSDIDLLVPGAEADRAREILLREGYEDAPVTLAAGRDHHHLVPLVHPEQQAAIELHTGVVPGFLAAALSDGDVWSRSRPFRRGSLEVRLPHPTDAAAISFLHAELVDLGTALWLIPLREFCDLAMLQKAFGAEIDWSDIRERAARVGGATRLRRYAYVYERLSGERLLPGRNYTMLDAMFYRLSLAAIRRPGIRRWPMRAQRLSAQRLQRKYGTDESGLGTGLARTKELTRMLGGAVGVRRDGD